MDKELTLYAPFIKEIKELIHRHQYDAMKAVNHELMQLYWEIGRGIDKKQREEGWGRSVVRVLAKELQKEFPGVRGFSARNLWVMRNFYNEYSENVILPSSMAEIQDSKLATSMREIQNPIVQTSSALIPNPIVQTSPAEIQNPIVQTSPALIPNPIVQTSPALIPNPIVPTSLAQISWSKNVVIMQKCKDPFEREFYAKMTKRYGWTYDVLINNIENKAFEKYLLNQTNFDETVPEKYRMQAKLAVKDDYNFDFIEMGIEHSEAELEAGIMRNINGFLSEMGGDISFIGNQYHLDVADEDHYIDLLLYLRRLRCLVAMDLKIGDFKPEYAGKMQFYLAALDDIMKLPEENPSVGIIVCKNKNRTKVEYTLRTTNRPIGVATYSFYDDLPEEFRSMLPSPEKIADIVRGMDKR